MGRKNALSTTKPDKVGLDPGALDRLGDVFRREIDSGRLPGAVVLIARGGKIGYLESFGVRDPATKDEMAEDSIFRIYSMTKPIVSTAIMQMVEEGRIQIADPLSAYIPAFAETKVGVAREGGLDLVAPSRPITIQDLLRHTSGLTYEFLGEHPVQKAYLEAKIASTNQTNAEHVARLASLPLLNHPGVAWDYSRSTDVLGRVVEIVSGRTLGEELRARILDPLGMDDTAFSVPEKQQHRIAEPFDLDPDAKTPVSVINVRRPAKFESGGGGLVSTAHDYARFCAMLAGYGSLGGTRILGRKTLEWMASDHLGPGVKIGSDLLPAGHGFGLGFAVRNEPGIAAVPGSPGVFYWGGIAGTSFWIDWDEDLFALMLIQAPGQRDYYRMLFRSLVYAAVD
jgi:CubicO group peptidase (beta-lactamase class C family)